MLKLFDYFKELVYKEEPHLLKQEDYFNLLMFEI